MFYLALPVGSGIGYAISGFFALFLPWYFCFFLETIPMITFLCILLFAPVYKLNDENDQKTKKNDKISSSNDQSSQIPSNSFKNQLLASENDQLVAQSHNDNYGITPNPTNVEMKSDYEDNINNLEILNGNDSETNSPDKISQEKLLLEKKTTIQNTKKPKKEKRTNFILAMGSLICNGVYVSVVLGYTGWAFCIGALSLWMPTYIKNVFHVSPAIGSLGFSVIWFLFLVYFSQNFIKISQFHPNKLDNRYSGHLVWRFFP